MHHVLLSVPFDLAAIEEEAGRDLRPRHYLHRVAQTLGAKVHETATDAEITTLDRLLGKATGMPRSWAQARRVARQLSDGDVVFTADADAVILGLLCRLQRKQVKILSVVTWVDSKRYQLLLKTLGGERFVDRFLVNTELKAARLRALLGRRAGDRVCFAQEQTDLRFFTPGPKSSHARPRVFSAGREHRDYVTLAEATASLDLDVKVCAISPNAGDIVHGRFPEQIPANMEFVPYPWREFRQAYRDADVVVVPTLGGFGSPGLTVAIEAMACRRPVIITRTEGTASTFIDDQCAIGVGLHDPVSLAAAIRRVIENPAEAEAMAERGYQRVLREHSSDRLVVEIVRLMRGLAGESVLEPVPVRPAAPAPVAHPVQAGRVAS